LSGSDTCQQCRGRTLAMARRRSQRLERRALAAWLLCTGLPACVRAAPHKGVHAETFTRYAPKEDPNDGTVDDGTIGGKEGDWSRYRHMRADEFGNTIGITDEDRHLAVKIAHDVKCPACEALLERMVGRAKYKTEDGIMDVFENDTIPEWKVGLDQQLDQMMMNRKACNKHFKDEMLFEGWAVEKCISNTGKEWCLVKGNKPTEEQVETFSSENDAFWYVCSATIAAHGSELASFIAERMEDSEPLKKAVKAACKKVADCDGTKLKKRQKAAKKRQEKEKKAKKAAEEREKREADEF